MTASLATVKLCAKAPCGPAAGGTVAAGIAAAAAAAATAAAEAALGGGGGSGGEDRGGTDDGGGTDSRMVYALGSLSADEMRRALRPTDKVRVLRVRNLHNLQVCARVHLSASSCRQLATFSPRAPLSPLSPLSRPPPSAPSLHVRPPHARSTRSLSPRARSHALPLRVQLLGSSSASVFAPSLGPSRSELNAVTRGFWCTACPITRKGAVVHEHNKSVVRELEGFCKQEARAKLGDGVSRACCSQHGACHACQPWERRAVRNESALPWALRTWVPVLARLETLPTQERPCAHPFCTGSDRKAFP